MNWGKKQAEYMLLVEPVNTLDRDKMIDYSQQMISRPKLEYDKKFKEFGFDIIHEEEFN